MEHSVNMNDLFNGVVAIREESDPEKQHDS